MKDRRSGCGRWVVVLCAAAFATCFGGSVLVASPFVAAMRLNDRTLHEQSARLDAALAGQQVLARHDSVQLHLCCSNHCDFFSGRVVRGDPTDVLVSVAPDLQIVDPRIEPESDLSPLSVLQDMQAGRDLLQSALASGPDTTVVYAFEQTYTGFAFDYDLRCH